MEGVDSTDRLLALYPHLGFRTNKWTIHTMEMIIINFSTLLQLTICKQHKNDFSMTPSNAEEILAH